MKMLLKSVAVTCVIGCAACAPAELSAYPATVEATPEASGMEDASAFDAQAVEGQPLYDRLCGSCHPGGQADLGPQVAGLGWSQERMTEQIREGSGRMRPIANKRLSDAQMPPMLAYLRTLGAVR